jgi:tetratricopeptide (TPR) repeat protein
MTDKISALQEKLASNPDQIFHRYCLAQAYFEDEQLDLACEEFQKCLESKPDWMMAALFLGKAFLEKENKEEARVYLEKALVLAKDQNHDDPADEAAKLLNECSRPK